MHSGGGGAETDALDEVYFLCYLSCPFRLQAQSTESLSRFTFIYSLLFLYFPNTHSRSRTFLVLKGKNPIMLKSFPAASTEEHGDSGSRAPPSRSKAPQGRKMHRRSVWCREHSQRQNDPGKLGGGGTGVARGQGAAGRAQMHPR